VLRPANRGAVNGGSRTECDRGSPASGPGGNERPLDLYVGSIYNSPDANLGTLLRNDGAEFPKLAEMTLPGVAARGNRLALRQASASCSRCCLRKRRATACASRIGAAGAPFQSRLFRSSPPDQSMRLAISKATGSWILFCTNRARAK